MNRHATRLDFENGTGRVGFVLPTASGFKSERFTFAEIETMVIKINHRTGVEVILVAGGVLYGFDLPSDANARAYSLRNAWNNYRERLKVDGKSFAVLMKEVSV